MGHRRWLNIVAILIVGILLLLSGILMATTLFPGLDVISTGGYLAVAMLVLAGVGVILLRVTAGRCHKPERSHPVGRASVEADRSLWRMPPLARLQPVTWSTKTRLGMLALRGYLVIGAVLLVVKVVQLSHG